jgi:hypothetical protein
MPRDMSWVEKAKELQSKGMKYAEIGKIVGKSYSAVRVQLDPVAKEVLLQYMRDQYAANPEPAKKRATEWANKNPEKKKENLKEWRKENRERLNEKHRKWEADNYEKVKARKEQWQDDNRDKVNASNRRWRKENPEKFKEIRDAWVKENPDKVREGQSRYAKKHPEKMQAKSAKRRARKMNVAINDLADEQWAEILASYDGHCCYCGRTDRPLTQDHIIPITSKGNHTASNVAPACDKCNPRKGASTIEEWIKRGGYPLHPPYIVKEVANG